MENSYGRHVLTGIAMSILAGVFLFAFSLFLTTVLYPDLINEMKTVQTQSMKLAGRSEAEIAATLGLQTPMIQAIQGLIGTVVIGILASLVTAIFMRKKNGVRI